ncbi:toxin TcdB middle/N-terminal domain-containing protein [Roseovarius aestuarii]|uniref:tRNA(Glu)-specific nuclease WapA n=1 Tax=Roseovarius aestuarii TaxID=475083 RepID=A0A1X7BW72_9RHOB|nr:toxin TcdB middle/N-terminal domain-containing protein [Roseovarius aestuarii]SMC13876.1 tRNA(Glu)-specific nuclease WapA precursor [Roseovarius aestuarii]
MAAQNGTDSTVLPLPKGGGAARAIDEEFQINLNTGGGLYQIPIRLPKGVDDHQPNLVLSYSTGKGNGPFGLGWELRVPSIRIDPDRRRRGVDPVFLFEGRRLSPVGGGRYQPVAEAEFSRITRLPGDAGWEVRTKTGQLLRMGTDPSSRVGDGVETREWLLDDIRDINGNTITFTWEEHGNRAYLSRVAYAIYEVHFAYEARPDAHSSFRDGYEVETARRCSQIAVLLTVPDPRRFKTYRLNYTQAAHSEISLLTRVDPVAQEQTAQGGPVTELALPPVSMEYTTFDPGSAQLEILDAGSDLPPALSQSDTTLLDLDGTGRPGVIQMSGGTARFWANHGTEGWGAPRSLGNLPTSADLGSGSLILADMEGNGTADLIDAAAQTNGFFPAIPGGEWGRKIDYRESPTTALADPSARLVDLDGDGRVDLLTYDGSRAYHYFNEGADGWDPAPVVTGRGDFPPVDLADDHTRFADMAGDGRSHLVSIHDRRVVWYPNLGQGRWGGARHIANAPELPRHYDPDRLFLADVDGSGMADVIYVDFDRVMIWINRSGRSFAPPVTIPGTPPMAAAAILIADMRGRGTRGILWSYPAALRGRDAYRYLDPTGGTKPYLLTRIVNNRQVETRLTYSTSTDWARDRDDPDIEQAGFLPFPVPVVARIDVTDPARGLTSSSEFEYRNGHFDGDTRTFTGFGRGTRRDLGDASIPTLATVSYFHTLDPGRKGLSFLTRTFGEDGSVNAHRPYQEEESRFEMVELAVGEDGEPIRHIRRTEAIARTLERGANAMERRTVETYDAFGNVTEIRETATWNDGAPQENVTVTTRSYTSNEPDWLVGLPVRDVTRDGAGNVLSAKVRHYDGPDFAGLPEGQVTVGNLTRETDLAMLPEHDIFGFDPARIANAGYHSRNDAELGGSFWVDSVSQRRDANGLLAERRNERGTPTVIEFDNHNLYPARIVFDNGAEIRAEYDLRYGGINRYTDVNGVERGFAYDIAGRLISASRFDDAPGQPFMEHRYDETAVPMRTETLTRAEPGGPQHRKVQFFDGVGEVIQTRAEAADSQIVVSGRKDLNTRGLLELELEPYFSTGLDFSTADQTAADRAVRITYDALGRTLSRTDWNGEVYRSEYALGQAVHSDPFDLDTTPGNAKANTPQRVHSDALGRVTLIREEHETGAYETRYSYDAAGRRTGVEINRDTFASNTYDCLGRRIRSVYRDAGTWTFFHDASGNLEERQDGKGDRVHNSYDGLNRITELRHGGPAGSPEESYRYDVGEPGETHTMGKLTQVTGPFGVVRYGYGPCGCLQSKTREFPGLAAPQTFTYLTDALDRYQTVIYPDGFAQDMLYDEGGLLRAIPGVVNRIDYTATGRKAQIEYASGVVTRYIYEPGSQRLLQQVTTAPDGTTTYVDATYAYDVLGAVETITDAANVPGHVTNTRGYHHDGLSQILEETGIDGGGAYANVYDYDAHANLTAYPESFGPDAIVHGDPAHPFQVTDRGTPAAPAGYAYDAAGNITQTPTCQYTFDARNRLTRIDHSNGTVITYQYDHQGVRVVTQVTVGAVTDTEFNFDDVFLINGATTTRIVFDPEGALAMVRSDGTQAVFHQDHLRSHVAATDLATGSLFGTTTYYAFGRIATTTGGIPGPFRYNGKKYDEACEMVFFGSRYYLPELGRFLSPDRQFLEHQPDRFFASPRQLALYTFVMNNPVNMLDPDGSFAFLAALGIAALIGFAVGVGAYSINQAVSGGTWQLSEALFSGLMGAVAVGIGFAVGGLAGAFIVGAAMLLKPAVTGALDQAAMGDDFGSRFLGFLSFAIKFASSPVTSTIGLLIGGFGTGFGLWGDVEWFKGGVIAFEYNPGSAGFSAVTLGATVNIWEGNTNNALFAHELYHSRQYTYFGDAFIPFWLLGGVYGLISSAAAGNFQWDCFNSGNPTRGYGNPLEDGAHAAARGGGCT